MGRIIDASSERHYTIEAVNKLADILLSADGFNEDAKGQDRQWLSSIENLVLCVLCKVRGGQTAQASQLARHWLNKDSVEHFNTAAAALCDSGCFKRGGPHVFTPSWSGPAVSATEIRHVR